MASFDDYKGLKILTPEPDGEGGKALNDNFKVIADRAEGVQFTQPTPSALWSINHGLNRKPHVTTQNADGEQIIGNVVWPNLNVVIVQFTKPIAGSAYLH